MSAPLTVVIPVRNSVGRIGPCLAALTEGVMDGLVRELILADAASTDAVDDLAEATGARLVTAEPGRGPQLAAGAAAATGGWLMFLHDDTVLAPGWPEAVRRHIETRPDRAGHFRLAFDSATVPARLVAGWANLRAGALALPYGDQGLVVSATLYRSVGGHPPLPLMEDVALARRLGRRRLGPIDATATTSAARYEAEGWLARGARNLSTLALWRLGVPADRLARRYEAGGGIARKGPRV